MYNFRYFIPQKNHELLTENDGILLRSAADFRIPYLNHALIDTDLTMQCPDNFYIEVTKTNLQLKKGVDSFWFYENRSGAQQIITIKTKITNNINQEYVLDPAKTISIAKGEIIGRMTIKPIAKLDGWCRLYNHSDLYTKTADDSNATNQMVVSADTEPTVLIPDRLQPRSGFDASLLPLGTNSYNF